MCVYIYINTYTCIHTLYIYIYAYAYGAYLNYFAYASGTYGVARHATIAAAEVLRDAQGAGPRESIFCLGYCNHGPMFLKCGHTCLKYASQVAGELAGAFESQ